MCLNPNNGVIHWQQNLFNTNYALTSTKELSYCKFKVNYNGIQIINKNIVFLKYNQFFSLSTFYILYFFNIKRFLFLWTLILKPH